MWGFGVGIFYTSKKLTYPYYTYFPKLDFWAKMFSLLFPYMARDSPQPFRVFFLTMIRFPIRKWDDLPLYFTYRYTVSDIHIRAYVYIHNYIIFAMQPSIGSSNQKKLHFSHPFKWFAKDYLIYLAEDAQGSNRQPGSAKLDWHSRWLKLSTLRKQYLATMIPFWRP